MNRRKKLTLLAGLIIVFLSLLMISLEKSDLSLSPKDTTQKTYFNFFHEVPSVEKFRDLTYTDQEKIVSEISNYSPEYAWTYIVGVTKNEEGSLPLNRHILSHLVGNKLYEKNGIQGIHVCTNEYAFGCFHGVMEEFLFDRGPEKFNEAQKICKKSFPRNTDEDKERYFSCTHGIGHGLFSMPELDVHKSLEYCDQLESSERCYGGVFMERAIFTPTMLFDTTKDPWELCEGLNQKYHSQCALFQVPLITRVYEMTVSEATDSCMLAPTEELKRICVQQIGITLARKTPDNIGAIEDGCKSISNKRLYAHCQIQAAWALIQDSKTRWKEKSEELCNRLPKEWLESCLKSNSQAMEKFIR